MLDTTIKSNGSEYQARLIRPRESSYRISCEFMGKTTCLKLKESDYDYLEVHREENTFLIRDFRCIHRNGYNHNDTR